MSDTKIVQNKESIVQATHLNTINRYDKFRNEAGVIAKSYRII